MSIRVAKTHGVWGKSAKIGRGQMAKPRVLSLSGIRENTSNWIREKMWKGGETTFLSNKKFKATRENVERRREYFKLGGLLLPNLVRIVGYSREDKQFHVAYEYMEEGSLESHLFRKGVKLLSWNIRLKIAIGAARGLAFLHSAEKQVIFQVFKISNILLNREFNAKISNYGLATLGPINGDPHGTTFVKGTSGYAAPEYLSTGAIAGVYVGMEYGIESVRGTRDWKNAMISGAITGALASAFSSNNRDKIVMDAITGGAVATAAEFLKYLN